jgi:hypothetical protein
VSERVWEGVAGRQRLILETGYACVRRLADGDHTDVIPKGKEEGGKVKRAWE